MNRAVFLDRDGTVNVEVGYLSSLDQLRLVDGAGAAIKRMNDAGLLVVLITNQSGVARGYFSEAFVHATHDLLTKMLQEHGAKLDGVYYCPHHPKAGASSYTRDCDCRKPRTGLLDRAARELDIDLKASCMVGDKWSDVELGQRAGMRTVLVKSGFSPDDPGNARPGHVREPDLTAHSIHEAADWVLEHIRAEEQ